MGGTRLTEVKLRDVTKAAAAFQPRDNVTPLVLVPTSRTVASWVMFVPSDCYVLMQRCGKHVPEGQTHYDGAGIKFMPPWWRIAYLVTRQAVTYNAPVASVPTKDNVPVEVDITLVFTISDPYKFVYELGVLRFDEYLHAATDESIRMLVREQPHHEIRDMKGEFGSTMLSNMNSKFNQLGVDFTTVLVTDVKLPTELADMLENITTVKAQRAVQERDFEFELRKMNDESKKEVQKLEQQNEAELVKLEAQKNHATIERKRLEARINEHREKTLKQAEESLRVLDINTKAALERTVHDAENNARMMQADAEVQAVKKRREAERISHNALQTARQHANQTDLKIQAEVKQMEMDALTQARAVETEAQAVFKETEAEAKGQMKNAEAEGKAQQAFSDLRKFELRKQQLDIQSNLAKNGKVVLKAGSADRVIESFSKIVAEGVDPSGVTVTV